MCTGLELVDRLVCLKGKENQSLRGSLSGCCVCGEHARSWNRFVCRKLWLFFCVWVGGGIIFGSFLRACAAPRVFRALHGGLKTHHVLRIQRIILFSKTPACCTLNVFIRRPTLERCCVSKISSLYLSRTLFFFTRS